MAEFSSLYVFTCAKTFNICGFWNSVAFSENILDDLFLNSEPKIPLFWNNKVIRSHNKTMYQLDKMWSCIFNCMFYTGTVIVIAQN